MADGDPVLFDESSGRKIAAVVRTFRPVPHRAYGQDLPVEPGRLFPVRVTGSELVGGRWRHTAVEVGKADTSDDWFDVDGGRAANGGDGSDAIFLYTSSNNQLPDETVPVWVLSILFPDPATLEDEGGPTDIEEWWTADTPLPVGQYQYMLLGMSSQNGPPAYDFARLHPPIV